MSFDPQMVTIKHQDGSNACVFKVLSITGDNALVYHLGAVEANVIQSLTPASGKFQVGSDGRVNELDKTFYYFAAAVSSLSGAWVGGAIEIQAGSVTELFTGTPMIYGENGETITKMSVTANVITVQQQKQFGANAALGKPAKFNAIWR